jgi:8-oxo-dGTP diphosphatase
MNISRTEIRDIVSRIHPFDGREREDVREILDRIDDGTLHLEVSAGVVDRARGSVLLMNHRQGGLWLPPGGLAEPDESPREAVTRNLEERLGSRALLVASVAAAPLLVSFSAATDPGSHAKANLWYVVFGDERMWIDLNLREFAGFRWSNFESVLATDPAELDPAMYRFVSKLQHQLAKAAG